MCIFHHGTSGSVHLLCRQTENILMWMKQDLCAIVSRVTIQSDSVACNLILTLKMNMRLWLKAHEINQGLSPSGITLAVTAFNMLTYQHMGTRRSRSVDHIGCQTWPSWAVHLPHDRFSILIFHLLFWIIKMENWLFSAFVSQLEKPGSLFLFWFSHFKILTLHIDLSCIGHCGFLLIADMVKTVLLHVLWGRFRHLSSCAVEVNLCESFTVAAAVFAHENIYFSFGPHT